MSPPLRSWSSALILALGSLGDGGSDVLRAVRILLIVSSWLMPGGNAELPRMGSSRIWRARMADLARASSMGGIWADGSVLGV